MNSIQKTNSYGQSIWLDSISRGMINSGYLKDKIEAGVTGVTSNPTIFQKALSSESIYDKSIKELFESGISEPKRIFQSISIEDLSRACDLLLPVYKTTNGNDGFVSIEIDPKFARKTEESIIEGHFLHKAINKPNIMIKVPGTEEGIPVIEDLISNGINVNVTLLFSRKMYRKAAKAYIKGLKKIKGRNQIAFQKVTSVASFFISRMDTVADDLLRNAMSKYKGKVAISNAILAYHDYMEIIATKEFKTLEKAGGNRQKLLWASTSVKNPNYDELLYVKSLVGENTINTVPEATLDALLDNVVTIDDNLVSRLNNSIEVIDMVERELDLSKISNSLLENGIKLFEDSFDDLLDEISSKIAKVKAK